MLKRVSRLARRLTHRWSAPEFYVFIPLRPRSVTVNWQLVCANLRRTLDNLLHQTDQAFTILLVCNDVPKFIAELPYAEKVRVIKAGKNLPVPSSAAEGEFDIWRKRRLVGAWLRKRVQEHLYLMLVDADDLINIRVVEYCRQDDNRRGYVFSRGYMVNERTREVALMNPETTPFYQHCGSCAVLYLRRRDLPKHSEDMASYLGQFGRHPHWIVRAREAGRPLQALPFYAALYMVDHGENDRAYVGKLEVKERFLNRNATLEANEAERLEYFFPGLERSHAEEAPVDYDRVFEARA